MNWKLINRCLTSRLARVPTYTIIFISGSHFLNSLAQFDKVDNGTTTRKGPWICWAFCIRNRNTCLYYIIRAFLTKQIIDTIPVENQALIPTEQFSQDPFHRLKWHLYHFSSFKCNEHSFRRPKNEQIKNYINIHTYLLTRKFKPSSW
jgi:hypothetical protein